MGGITNLALNENAVMTAPCRMMVPAGPDECKSLEGCHRQVWPGTWVTGDGCMLLTPETPCGWWFASPAPCCPARGWPPCWRAKISLPFPERRAPPRTSGQGGGDLAVPFEGAIVAGEKEKAGVRLLAGPRPEVCIQLLRIGGLIKCQSFGIALLSV